jgi:hypothetical protein
MTYDIERERRLLYALHADRTTPVPQVHFADPDGGTGRAVPREGPHRGALADRRSSVRTLRY